MKLINLFAGPGTGKSTTATALFAELKYMGVNCEYVAEYAKDAAWEKRGKKFFKAQQLIWGKQSFRLEKLRDEVDIAVTDSPLLLGLVYMPDDFAMPSMRQAIVEDHLRYDSLNVMLRRNKSYNTKGRNQTKEEALELDKKIWDMLEETFGNSGRPYEVLDFGRDNVATIISWMKTYWGAEVPALLK